MSHKKRVLIIGGGFGGAYCAQNLEKKVNPDEVELVLIDRNNYFIFYPLLVEAGTGSLEPRHAVVSIRSFLDKTIFRMGEVDDIDFDKQVVKFRVADSDLEPHLEYDQLVLSPGSVTNLPPVPGLDTYGFEIKSLSDAVALRDRAIELLEIADCTDDPEERKALLHFVVVGANFTGVEVAGEFDVFLKEATRNYDHVRASECQVTLVEMADRIITALEPELSEYAADHLKKRGIDIHLEHTVDEVKDDQIVLDDGTPLPSHTIVWCGGIAPSPMIEKLDVPTDERGYIQCERDLRVKDWDNVWAIGDSAVNPDENGNPYPPTAQHATGQAKHLAENIHRVLQDEAATDCDLSSRGSLAALGCRSAVARVFGIKLSGFPAWFLWRTVYLFKMPGWARRLRVALDWTMDLLFRRDIVQLGVHRQTGKTT